jgi:hypothetical protein
MQVTGRAQREKIEMQTEMKRMSFALQGIAHYTSAKTALYLWKRELCGKNADVSKVTKKMLFCRDTGLKFVG